MDKIKIVVTATNAVCVGSPVPLTTGMVGLLAEFTFSSEWDNLTKTAVCVGSGTTKDVLDVKDEIIVPHECLKDTAGHLKIGVYGVNSSGDLVIPTVYAYCGRLLQGADPSGDTSADPTLPIWAQLQALMGSLDNLTTTARDNLVAAINEAAKSGGGGAAADVRMQVAGGYIQYSSDGGANWNNLITMKELIGAPGKTAYDYAVEAGYTGTEAEFSARMAAEIPTVDGTLTQSGQAADAAAVRKELDSLSEEMLTEESDPTVPSWAKEAQKPSYTASEVGADPSGTAAAQVAAHNSGTDTHSDIRVLIQGLTDRLNALADSDDTTLDQMSEVVSYIKSNRSLIEAITTSKVSVADIIDNLTTNVTNKPLSAAQGVALKALIDAITVPDKLPNPNALTFTGAVTGTYDGSEPMTVNIPSGGSGSGAEKTWSLLLDETLSEDTAYIFQDLSAPVTELIIEFLAGGDGTHRDVTIFNRQGVGFGKNIATFKNVLRSDTNVTARFVIHCVAFPSLAFFRCQYNNYNNGVGDNVINASSQLIFNDENGAFKGNIYFDCISIGCWSGGNSGVFKAGTMVRVYGK